MDIDMQFLAEFFDLFQAPQFDLPNPSLGNPHAGISTVGNPMQVQMGLRFSF